VAACGRAVRSRFVGKSIGGVVFSALGFWLCYFAPSLVAWYRQRNGQPIALPLRQLALINLFIGWTVVGWFLALANALGYNPVPHMAVWIAKNFGTPPGGPARPPQQASSSEEGGGLGGNKVPCGTCNATGMAPCPSCHGRGSWYEQPQTATGVAELKHCTYCGGGNGKVQCSSCGGKGYTTPFI